MPTILTRSAGSARGFGFTGNPIYRIQKVLQNTSWVAPPGVTSILSLTGQGQNGYAAYWESISNLNNPPGYVPAGTFADVASQDGLNSVDVQALAQAQYDLFPNNPGAGTVNISWECRRYRGVGIIDVSNYGPYDIRATGTKVKTGGGWGTVYPPDTGGRPFYEIGGGMQYYIPQFDGANTTGFGYTFAGGVGGPATPTTYTNVPVTPGTTYTVNSTGDGYITIIYYQGG